MSDDGLLTWVLLWLAAATVVLLRHWRRGAGVGLLLAYVLSFGALHWLAATVYLLPWYTPPSADLTMEGLRLSAIGMVALAVGAEIASRWRRRPSTAALVPAGPGIATLYLVVGILMYGVIGPAASWIPTVSTLVSVGSTLAVVGLVLKYWNASIAGERGRAAGWLLVSAVFPFVTVVGQGFLGFGFVASMTVIVFAASWTRTRLMHVAAGLIVGYLGLSVYVTYMRDRADIREVVWGAESYERRLDRLWDTVSRPEWFNPGNPDHLQRVDVRLNQNFLVGAAVDYLDNRFAQFGNGETFVAALVAPIPRALWPDKPTVAGGAETVSAYTGIRFHGDTSVGVGQVMECYINFGTWGVAIGFFIIGALLVTVDGAAAAALASGQTGRFLLWYLPGLSLVQIGGAFSELTGTAAASLLLAVALNWATGLWMSRRHPYTSRRTAADEAQAEA